MKEDISSRLEQIDLLGCGGLFQQPGGQVHGCPWDHRQGGEVRALLGSVDGHEEQPQGGGPEHEHPHENEKGGP